MRRRAVRDAAAQRRYDYAVKGIRIAGAAQIFDVISGLFHGNADFTHKRVFAHAGAAFENDKITENFRVDQFREQIPKSAAAVRAREKISDFGHKNASCQDIFSVVIRLCGGIGA